MLCGLGASLALALLTYLHPSWTPFPSTTWLAPLMMVFAFRYFFIRSARTDPQFASERRVEYDDRFFRFNIPTGTWSSEWTGIEYLGIRNGYHHLKTDCSRATHQFIPVSSLSGEEHSAFHDHLAKSGKPKR